METMTTMLMIIKIKIIKKMITMTSQFQLPPLIMLLKSVNYANVLSPLKMNGDKPIVQGML
jgi:hypothetical protein